MKSYTIVNLMNRDRLTVTARREEVMDLIAQLNVLDPSGIYDLAEANRVIEGERSIREALDLESSPCYLDRNA